MQGLQLRKVLVKAENITYVPAQSNSPFLGWAEVIPCSLGQGWNGQQGSGLAQRMLSPPAIPGVFCCLFILLCWLMAGYFWVRISQEMKAPVFPHKVLMES